MYKNLYLTLVVSVLYLLSASVKAQTVQELMELSTEDYLAISLPPLDTLLDNSRHSGTMEYYKYRVIEEQKELKNVKWAWLQFFHLNANYQYGTVYSNTLLMDNNQPFYSPYNSEPTSFWNVGASISLPLSSVFLTGNRIKKQKAIVNQAENESQKYLDEQQIKIVSLYVTVLKSIALLKIKSETAALASAQYKLAEGNFISGQIDAAELNRQKGVESSSIQDYEEVKATLNSSLLQLEILSNTRIISNR